MKSLFNHFAMVVSKMVGSPVIFVAAFVIVLGWLVAGPYFGFSESWQLFINSFTTIITFLMVFILQNSQNRDTKTLHLKLDELLKAVKGARVGLINMDEYTDEELQELEKEFHMLHSRGFKKVAKGIQKNMKNNGK